MGWFGTAEIEMEEGHGVIIGVIERFILEH